MSMMCRPKWPFLHMYGSHDLRLVDFRGLTGNQRTTRVWGITVSMGAIIIITIIMGQGWRNNQGSQNYGWRNNLNNMPPSCVSEPPPEKKVDLEQTLAQMITSHTALMNETKANMHNQAT